jgi:hypothetical protein
MPPPAASRGNARTTHLTATGFCAGRRAGIAEVVQISPVAWQHINLYGRYEFTRTPAPIDVDTMVAAIAQKLH